ncbi:MAG: hypothetical protein AB1776_07340 [Bacillota bacterium]
MYLGVSPYIVRLASNCRVAPGDTVALPPCRASVLTIALKVKSSGPVVLMVDEQGAAGWEEKSREEFLAGDTMWECRLSQPDFRLRLYNPSPVDSVTVNVDANLPRRVHTDT